MYLKLLSSLFLKMCNVLRNVSLALGGQRYFVRQVEVMPRLSDRRNDGREESNKS